MLRFLRLRSPRAMLAQGHAFTDLARQAYQRTQELAHNRREDIKERLRVLEAEHTEMDDIHREAGRKERGL